MDLKTAVISVMDHETLVRLSSRFVAEAVDSSSTQAMIDALGRSRLADPAVLMEHMPEALVKGVCDAYGMVRRGRKRALIAQLLEVERRGGPEAVRLAGGGALEAVEAAGAALRPARSMQAKATPVKPARPPVLNPLDPTPFVAIDFETADNGRDSACAVALIKVVDNVIVDRLCHLIRPPRSVFLFTWLHNIAWSHVKDKPNFGALYPELRDFMEGATFLAAHNAAFDEAVLRSCCATYGHEPPGLPFACTVKLARAAWGIYPTRLNNVCEHLHIPLKHHDALSDAEACARIVMAAREKHWNS